MNKLVEGCLIVGVDFSPNDTNMMIVTRRKGDEIHIINTLKDEEAVEVYNKLIGVKSTNDVKHGHWELLDDCSNAGVYCSECHKKVYREHYANVNVKSKFCPNCGAIMDGEFEKL